VSREGHDQRKPTPPSVEVPYWRDANGDRAGFRDLTVGLGPAGIAELEELNAEAILRLMHAGQRALRAGEQGLARRLMSNASRLCVEPIGQFPASSVAVDL
jgi:hypothetical protein